MSKRSPGNGKGGDGPSGGGQAPSGSSTRAVHGGERQHRDSHAVTTPIYQTSTFWFENSQAVIDYNEGRNTREEYGRYGNPTWKAVERKLNELEGGDDSVLFASDYPHWDCGFPDTVKRMKNRKLSERTLEKIFWDNAVRLHPRVQ